MMIKGVLEVVFETSQPAEDACHGTWFCEPRDTERDVGELPCAKGEPNARLADVLSRGTFRRWVALLDIPPILHVVYIYLSIDIYIYVYIYTLCVCLSHTHNTHTTHHPHTTHRTCPLCLSLYPSCLVSHTELRKCSIVKIY
jgi:hypothetical protein